MLHQLCGERRGPALFLPQAHVLVCAEGDGIASLSLRSGARVSCARARHGGDAALLCPAGARHALTAGRDGSLRTWSVNKQGAVGVDQSFSPLEGPAGAGAARVLQLATPTESAWRGQCYALVGPPREPAGGGAGQARCKLVCVSLAKRCVSRVIDQLRPSDVGAAELPAGALGVAERRAGATTCIVVALATRTALRLYSLPSLRMSARVKAAPPTVATSARPSAASECDSGTSSL